jgi:hypothetical protein
VSNNITKIKIVSLPASNDNIFELSDFHNLVTTVRNYDADREAQSYVKTHQQLFELLMPKKI